MGGPVAFAMTASAVEQVARVLLAARRDRRAADAAPWADVLASPAQAYEVQALVAQGMAPEAGFPRYWKAGGPSRETLLTHAALPAKGVWTSPADARAWPFNLRLIEAEIALRLGADVTAAQAARMKHEAAASLIDAMAVSIEVVDSRWLQGPAAPPLLKLADLQSHGALVVGDWRPYSALDWGRQACSVRIGAQAAAEFRGAHALGDPAWVLPAWLRHATRAGETVPRGTVVTTGTWCGMLPASQGDLVVARFEGVGEAAVRL